MTTALDLCSLAWGDRDGYVCLSLRDTSKSKEESGYWVDKVFKWPEEQPKVADALERAKSSAKDVYWAPSVFTKPRRDRKVAARTDMLWADLDEVEPDSIPKHLKPTAVWESSPGRYQALWKMSTDLDPAVQQDLNQRLTYAIGADKGGWDTTQVLRTPDTHNHKYENAPAVRLLYLNGHQINPSIVIEDLPEISSPELGGQKLPDPKLYLARFKLNARTKELMKARHASVGQRSDRLWELECLLAEAGMAPEQIAAVAQRTVWNKFKGRRDEVRRLLIEAAKAHEHAGVLIPDDGEAFEVIEGEDTEHHGPEDWTSFDRTHQPITWMVADIWGESEVGFISGLPKSYKSWLALDLAVSVATGTRFLDTFQARKHNVLLIQEEDPRPVLQDRLVKIGAAKGLVGATVTGKTTFDYVYDLPDNLYVISNQGFSISEEWLEQLEVWITERDVKMCILDPLMMIAGGGFDEFKAFEFMEKVLKPLKRVRARTGAAIVLVHHHLKGSTDAGAKSMYGSVALWAWEEAALHLQISGVGKITAERFSKHSLLPPITIEIGDVGEVWSPTISTGASTELYDVLRMFEGGATVDELIGHTSLTRDVVTRQLKSLEGQGKVEKAGTEQPSGGGRPRQKWKVR